MTLTTTNRLAAYLYLHLAEPMPAPLDDVEADNAAIHAWATSTSTLDLDLDRLGRFLDRVELLLVELNELVLDPDEDAATQYMTLVYNAGKDVFDHDKSQLRTFFRWFYLVVFHSEEGPRWGDFIEIIGPDGFEELVRRRFGEIF